MDTNSEQNLLDVPPPENTYASFWDRLWATMIDGLILSAFVLPLTYFDMIEWKSPFLYLIMSIVSLGYKPFCEFQFGATVGKMALKIKVVNYQHESASVIEVLYRNGITMLTGLASTAITMSLFSMPGFDAVRTYVDYIGFAGKLQWSSWISYFMLVYYLVDVIFLMIDERKRTLHDRIGKTYVIKSE